MRAAETSHSAIGVISGFKYNLVYGRESYVTELHDLEDFFIHFFMATICELLHNVPAFFRSWRCR